MPEMTEEQLQEAINKAVAAETTALKDKRDQLLEQEVKLKADIQKIKDDQAAAIKQAEDDKLAAEGKWKELAEKQKEDHEAELKQLRESNQALVEKNNTLDKSLRSRIVDQDLNNQLLAAGVTDPILMKAATALLSSNVEVITDDEGEMVARVNGKSIEDHIGEWSKGEGKSFITAKNSGGGSSGDGGGKGVTEVDAIFDPASPKFSKTKQAELERTDPEAYKEARQKFPLSTTMPMAPGM